MTTATVTRVAAQDCGTCGGTGWVKTRGDLEYWKGRSCDHTTVTRAPSVPVLTDASLDPWAPTLPAAAPSEPLCGVGHPSGMVCTRPTHVHGPHAAHDGDGVTLTTWTQ